MSDQMQLKKVTGWSAETADGAIYAEKIKIAGRKWTVCRLRGRGRGTLGVFPSFKSAAKFVADLGEQP